MYVRTYACMYVCMYVTTQACLFACMCACKYGCRDINQEDDGERGWGHRVRHGSGHVYPWFQSRLVTAPATSGHGPSKTVSRIQPGLVTSDHGSGRVAESGVHGRGLRRARPFKPRTVASPAALCTCVRASDDGWEAGGEVQRERGGKRARARARARVSEGESESEN